ncbi:MAG: Do family serine endopeptidase [Candidatus Eisenbacteria bacterium]|nr:Do family serine endopeptidase [Candidatus Eisenbacteria bacterium]
MSDFVKSMRSAKWGLVALGLVSVGIVIGFIMSGAFNLSSSSQAKNVAPLPSAAGLPSLADVVQSVLPGVVQIDTKRKVTSSPHDFRFEGPFEEYFRRLFPDLPRLQQRERVVPNSGSGFVISEGGFILTANHLIRDADAVEVTLHDGRKFKGKVVGADSNTDLAVIKIDADKLTAIPFGNSDELRVGDWVIAIGSPFGKLEGTVTFGIVSAKGRSDLAIQGGGPQLQNFIQTDAAINFGNSGGPLVNMRGEAVGVNTAITYGAQNLGFAVPTSLARKVSDQLISHGKVVRGYLGILPQELTPELAETWGVKDAKGIVVGSVEAGTPADKAGLKVKDIIIEFDGKKVKDVSDFRIKVADTDVNAKVKLVVLRDGAKKELSVTVGQRPEAAVAAKEEEKPQDWLGLKVDALTPDAARELKLKVDEGVFVTGVESGSPADEAGFAEKDVIVEVNDTATKTVGEFNKAISKGKASGKPIVFLVSRGNYTMFIAVKTD